MADDLDPIDSAFEDTDALTAAVYKELLALRGAHGRLTVEKFSRYPLLHLVCGGRTVLDAFLVFERQLQRFIRTGDQHEVAAAISLTADAERVVDRLEEVLGHFEEPDGPDRNQRTARRWSNQGMRSIATDLVHLGDVQQRLGSELITIELSGTYEGGLSMELCQLTTRHPDERAPLVRLWCSLHEPVDEQENTVTYDLDHVEFLEGSTGPYRLRRYVFDLAIPTDVSLASVKGGSTVYRISIEGRDAPLRAVSFQDESNLSEFFALRFTAYLTDATIEVVKRPR